MKSNFSVLSLSRTGMPNIVCLCVYIYVIYEMPDERTNHLSLQSFAFWRESDFFGIRLIIVLIRKFSSREAPREIKYLCLF